MNKTRSDAIEDLSGTLTYIELVLLAVVMISICAVTIVGNALVLISFWLDKKLRTLSNCFLLSLAISDVMIATFSMPIFTAYFLIGEWTMGRALCNMWLSQDYTCSNASILNLLMIAIDRYCSVTDPLGYRAKRTPRRVAIMIACVWTISLLLYPPWIYAWPYIEGRNIVPEDDCYIQFLETNTLITIATAVVDYYVPLLIILALYFRIWRETRRRSRYLADMKTGYQTGSMWLAQFRSSRQKKKKRGHSPKSVLSSYSNSKLKPEDDGTVKDSGRALLAGVARNGLETTSDNETDIRAAEHPHSETSDNVSRRSVQPDTPLSQQSGGAAKPPNSTYQKNKQELSPKLTLSSHPKSSTDHCSSRSGDDAEKDVEVALLAGDAAGHCNNTAGHPESKTSDNISEFSGQSVGPNTPASQKSASKPDKAARVLTVILLAFVVTSVPYNVTVIIKNLDSTHSLVPDAVWSLFYYLFYINSTLNPLCYALANENFRRTYWRILTCSWSRSARGTYSIGSYSSTSDESRKVSRAKQVTSPV